MDTAQLIDQASAAMGEPVHEVVTIKRMPWWALWLTLPVIAAQLLVKPSFLVAVIVVPALAFLVLLSLTEKRFVAIADARCALLRGNRWLRPDSLAIVRELATGDVVISGRSVRIAGKLFGTSNVKAQMLSDELTRLSQLRSENRI